MHSVELPGARLKIGAGQDQYNVIHAIPVEGSPEGIIVAAYQLTDEEIEQIRKSRRIYYTRMTFFQDFQPMRIFTDPSEVPQLQAAIECEEKNKQG